MKIKELNYWEWTLVFLGIMVSAMSTGAIVGLAYPLLHAVRLL